MSAAFKVGDICIGQNFIKSTHRNGAECQIIGAFKLRSGLKFGMPYSAWAYQVRWDDGSETNQEPPYLRKKQPPRSYKSKYRQAMLDCIAKAKEPVREPA